MWYYIRNILCVYEDGENAHLIRSCHCAGVRPTQARLRSSFPRLNQPLLSLMSLPGLCRTWTLLFLMDPTVRARCSPLCCFCKKKKGKILSLFCSLNIHLMPLNIPENSANFAKSLINFFYVFQSWEKQNVTKALSNKKFLYFDGYHSYHHRIATCQTLEVFGS